jgi:hypothetical protein
MALCAAAGSVLLTRVNTPLRTAVGALGVGTGSHPVVELAGLESDGHGFAALTSRLRAAGVTVLDFDPARAGVQPLTWRPASGREHLPQIAARVVQPAIRAALSRAGLDPDRTVVDVVAHSAGGLLARFLVEQPGAAVASWSDTRGWYGDTRRIDPGWAARIDDLVLVATPDHGTTLGSLEATVGPGVNPFEGVGEDIAPGSPFLRRMGVREPAGEVYTTIGGDPWVFRFLRYGHHGFDGAVPAESPFLTGAAVDTFDHTHGRLLPAPEVVALITATLAAGG